LKHNLAITCSLKNSHMMWPQIHSGRS